MVNYVLESKVVIRIILSMTVTLPLLYSSWLLRRAFYHTMHIKNSFFHLFKRAAAASHALGSGRSSRGGNQPTTLLWPTKTMTIS